ncbi:hypothetical protein [Ravibacter arvi]
MRLHFLLFTLLSTCFFISCRKSDEPDKAPSPSLVQMEAEGGEETIALGSTGWRIAAVVNKRGNQRIFGDIYKSDGQLVMENTLLELEGTGYLEGTTPGIGFRIVHEGDQLRVTLLENGMPETYSFVIVLKRENETKEILVEQQVLQGYTFKSMEYAAGAGDGDSVFVRTGTRYEFNLLAPQQVAVNPFGGIDVVRTAWFESKEHGAFFGIGGDSVKVPIPVAVNDGKVSYSDPKDIYGAFTREAYHPGVTASVSVPAGKALFFTELEWRRRRLTYTLTLTNKRTGALKVITGKWLEESPTGKYSILRTPM